MGLKEARSCAIMLFRYGAKMVGEVNTNKILMLRFNEPVDLDKDCVYPVLRRNKC